MRIHNASFASFASRVVILASAAFAGCAHDSSTSDPSPSGNPLKDNEESASHTDLALQTVIMDDDAGASFHEQMKEHAQCLREHGVDWPDPPEGATARLHIVGRTMRLADAARAMPLPDGAVQVMPARAMPLPDGAPPPAVALFALSGDAGPHAITRVMLARPASRFDGGDVPQAALDACADKLPRAPSN